VTHVQEWKDWKTHIGSIGKLIPNLEAMVVDEGGNEVEPGKDGELWMRGPNICVGYLNNDDATRNSITEDGWLKSGDVGHVTSEGYRRHYFISDLRMFFISDRVKELIKFKGLLRKVETDIRVPSPASSSGGPLGVSSECQRCRSSRSLR
jgi:4-coumarate--CoA ligase